MTAKRLFVDTAAFIYLVENKLNYADKVTHYFTNGLSEEAAFETSVLTYAEYCVKPQQLNRLELIKRV